MDDSHQRIRAAVTAFARGELVIVADDDDRENEGDLFVAASLCTPEKMAFIIRHTSGIVCAPLAPEEALTCFAALMRARKAWAARCCSTCSIGLVGAAAAGRTIRW